MEYNQLRTKVLLSFQRALLGMIYPSIRAITIGFESEKVLKVICYLDRKPNEEDFENLSEVTSEVCSDFQFEKVDEKCIESNEPISKLYTLSDWVFIRKEI